MTKKALNGGVDNNNGMALQRNTAIFLLLENYYRKFQNKKYFICLEHHDDFLFCFLNENYEVYSIEAYQSKKKSSDIWRLNPEFYKILTKLLNTGKDLIKDEILKSPEYKHVLYFSTNQTIILEHSQKKQQLPTISVSIKADNPNSFFPDLPNEIKEKIFKSIVDINLQSELKNLSLIWIPFTTTSEEQENQLVGKIDKVFGNKVFDKRAALNTLVLLFEEIEKKYNNGNKAKLLDISKRVDNAQVEDAFRVLSTKSKCFDYWHSRESDVAKALQIKPVEKEPFKLIFSSAFDLFKILEEAEHRKILHFVKEKHQEVTTFSEEENVFELFNLFKKSHRSNFTDLRLKAILFAALFEVLNIKEN
jgi:hypothetical protein